MGSTYLFRETTYEGKQLIGIASYGRDLPVWKIQDLHLTCIRNKQTYLTGSGNSFNYTLVINLILLCNIKYKSSIDDKKMSHSLLM